MCIGGPLDGAFLFFVLQTKEVTAYLEYTVYLREYRRL